MPGTPNARLVKGGLIVLAPGGRAVQRAVALQYNPETLARSFEVQGEGGGAGQPWRLKGPAIETVQLVAEFDATDALEAADAQPGLAAAGLGPQLALLESLVQPSAAALAATGPRARTPEAPLVLFVWGVHRVVPVRVAQLAITEEAFDAALNPLRARVALGLRVLSTDDFAPGHRGAAIFLAHLRNRERLAQLAPAAALATLGLRELP